MEGMGGAATQAATGQIAYSIAAYNGDFRCLSWNAKALKSCRESGVIWFLRCSVEDSLQGGKSRAEPTQRLCINLIDPRRA